MKKNVLILLATTALLSVGCAVSNHSSVYGQVSDQVIAKQREALAKNTEGKGFGPQSPRDIDSSIGNNRRAFGAAPAYTEMNLCNIHFHKNAEHKGGEFTSYAGNGDSHGFQSGYIYSGHLGTAEQTPVDSDICPRKPGDSLSPGDTIEVHYVYSSVTLVEEKLGPNLGACLSKSIKNPQLRVEAQVYVLVNGDSGKGEDFSKYSTLKLINGYHQVVNIPNNTGTPIQYAGSTTGPVYNEKGSPLQVTWSVRPKVAKITTESVGDWCDNNKFSEKKAHGVRNLVINLDLLSKIER